MTYYCGDCKQECSVHSEDVGIGSYECHGVKGNDIQMVLSSDCCEAEVFENSSCTIEADYYQWKQDLEAMKADAEYDRIREEKLND